MTYYNIQYYKYYYFSITILVHACVHVYDVRIMHLTVEEISNVSVHPSLFHCATRLLDHPGQYYEK